MRHLSPSLRARGRAYAALAAGTYDRSVAYIDKDGNPQTCLYKMIVPVGYAVSTPLPGTLGVAGDGKYGTGGEQMSEGFPLWAVNQGSSLAEFVVAPELPIAPNTAGGPGVAATAYMACFAQAMQEVNMDTTRLGLVGVSGGGRDLWTLMCKWRGVFAYLAAIEGDVFPVNVNWAVGSSLATSLSDANILACGQYVKTLLGSTGLVRAIYQGQKGDDTTVFPASARGTAAGFGDTNQAQPYASNHGTYSGSPAEYVFQESGGKYEYHELQTGGHSWDDVLNSAAFSTWRQAQHL